MCPTFCDDNGVLAVGRLQVVPELLRNLQVAGQCGQVQLLDWRLGGEDGAGRGLVGGTTVRD